MSLPLYLNLTVIFTSSQSGSSSSTSPEPSSFESIETRNPIYNSPLYGSSPSILDKSKPSSLSVILLQPSFESIKVFEYPNSSTSTLSLSFSKPRYLKKSVLFFIPPRLTFTVTILDIFPSSFKGSVAGPFSTVFFPSTLASFTPASSPIINKALTFPNVSLPSFFDLYVHFVVSGVVPVYAAYASLKVGSVRKQSTIFFNSA